MMRHFTATAFIIHQGRTLLLWHKRLQRWMPPGGHVDPDETPEECAKRECKEETGLDVEIIGDASQDLFRHDTTEGRMLLRPFALLLEEIPASPERGEPAHQHIDFLYHARLLDPGQEPVLAAAEGRELRWFTLEQLRALNDHTEIFANVKTYACEALSA